MQMNQVDETFVKDILQTTAMEPSHGSAEGGSAGKEEWYGEEWDTTMEGA
jgi:hypothetical protein